MKTLAVVLLLCFGTAGIAGATDLGLITGSENGTYYRFGLDLKRLVKSSGINLTVHPSKGAIDNLAAVYGRPGIHMGIVQSDLLDFIAGVESNALLIRIVKNIRLVVPLYTEEVHVLARREIGDFENLAGKRVAVGPEGSGTYLTARLLFKLSDVVPRELVVADAAQALAQLRAGQIDAMFYVAASPLKLLGDGLTAADGVTLVPITNKSILESYDPAEIPANVYEWQTTPVRTVAVKAVLVSFDFHGRECDSIGRFAQQLVTGMDWLTKNGDPRWRRVDLGYRLKGWPQYDCARKYLDAAGSAQASPAGRP